MNKGNIKKAPPKKVQPNQPIIQKKDLESTRYFDIISLGIIILVGIIIYSNSFDCSFHFDDEQSIVKNPKIQTLSDIKGLWNFNHKRFISYFTFAVNYHFDKLNVWGYHFVNLAIHLINACLVWWLTLLLFSTPALKQNAIIKRKKIIALIAGLLFVSHPLATQSVDYIVQRMAALVALFYFLSLALYVKVRLMDKGNSLKYILFAGAFISVVLAMLTKENSFTLPFAILMIEIFFLQTKSFSINYTNKRIYIIAAIFLCFLFYLFKLFTFDVLAPLKADAHNNFTTITSLDYLFTQFCVIGKYIQLLFLPINQNLDYDFHLSKSLFEPATILCFLILVSLLILAVYMFKKNRIISFGIFWFFLTLVIESSIIPISDVIFEHRTYLPSYGFFLILSSVITYTFWDKNKNIVMSIFIPVLLIFSCMTFQRNKVWKDDYTLWDDVIAKSPNKARPYIGRGLALGNDNKFSEALSDYTKVIELSPDFVDAYKNRSNIFINEKRYDEAIKDLNKIIELEPDNAKMYFDRGGILEIEKKHNEALADFNKAIELKPNYTEAYKMKFTIHNNENSYDEAINDLNKIIKFEPRNAENYYDLGIIFETESKHKEAVTSYDKAIALKPDFIDAYINRGNILGNENDNEGAIKDFDEVIKLKPDFPLAYNNRGKIYNSEKRYEDAIKDFNKAIELNPNYGKAFYNRGFSEIKLGKKESACVDLQKALKLGYGQAAEFYNTYCH